MCFLFFDLISPAYYVLRCCLLPVLLRTFEIPNTELITNNEVRFHFHVQFLVFPITTYNSHVDGAALLHYSVLEVN